MNRSITYVFWFCILIYCLPLQAQIINGSDYFTDSLGGKYEKVKDPHGKSYYIYKVGVGDTWNSIALKFGITYSELRLANKESDKLTAGSKIYVPADRPKLNDPFYEKKQPHVSGETPKTDSEKDVYHTVEKSQTLYSISKLHGTTVDQVKEWNGLTSNSISVGQKLLVRKGEKREPAPVITPAPKKKEEKKEPPPSSVKPGGSEKTPVYTAPPKKDSASEKPKSNSEVVKSNSADEEKIVFASGRKEVNESGLAVTLDEDESNSEKYFAIHRTAPVGTVIRITAKSNMNFVYAKVTGQLSNISENDGILIKISRSCAAKLATNEKSFKVDLLYGVNKD